jgi:hypothetical protein
MNGLEVESRTVLWWRWTSSDAGAAWRVLAAGRPNSMSRVFPGRSVRANSARRVRMSFQNRSGTTCEDCDDLLQIYYRRSLFLGG